MEGIIFFFFKFWWALNSKYYQGKALHWPELPVEDIFSSSGTSVYQGPGSVAQCVHQVNIPYNPWMLMKELICVIHSYAALESGSLFSFLLDFLDLIGTATVSLRRALLASAASIFDPFLSMVESNCLLPARCWDVCVRGGGGPSSHWVYNQQILTLRTRVQLKCLSPELLFQGLNYESSFSFEALIYAPSPATAAQPPLWAASTLASGCLCLFLPLDRLRCVCRLVSW